MNLTHFLINRFYILIKINVVKSGRYWCKTYKTYKTGLIGGNTYKATLIDS